MFVLVSYDIGGTDTRAGQKRLRRVAKLCENHGQRVQYSVFEVHCPATVWTKLRLALLDVIEPKRDSLRFYFLTGQLKGEHHGCKPSIDFTGPLVF